MIKLENVSKYYNTNNNVAIGIRKINLSLSLGEFVVITGASGSGKTTLLNVISGMDKYEEGTMYVNGEDTSYFSEADYEKYRNEYISFIFQNYNLIDSYSVYENVELALVVKGKSKKERHEQVLSIIEKVGLSDRINHKVTKLSGGEKQRVAIARALASEAPIIACDEITGNLDHQTGLEIIKLLKSVSENKLVLLVTHNPEEATPYATRLIRMYDGSISSDQKIKSREVEADISLSPIPPLTKKELIKIGFKNLRTTPKKTLLMFFILLTTALFISLSYSLYAKSEIDADSYYIRNEANRYQGRIVVKKADSSTFTEEELENIKRVGGVKNLIVDDIVLDNVLELDFELPNRSRWESVFSFNIRSVGDISKSNLTYGTLPDEEYEIVVSLNEKIVDDWSELIDKTVSTEVVAGYYQDFVISGIIFDELSRNNVYVTNDFIKKVRPMVESTFSMTRIEPVKKETPLPFGTWHFNYYIDENLSDEDIFVETYVYDKIDGKDPEEEIRVNLHFENPYHKMTINNLKVELRRYNDDDLRNNRYYSAGIIRLSPNNYQKLNLGKTHQISLTVSDNANPEQVVKDINNKGYLSFHAAVDFNDNGLAIIGIIFNIFILGVSVILMIVVYLIAFLALKNVMMSKKKDYLIMRSLGVKSGKIKGIVYTEVISLTLVATIFWIVIIALIKNYTSSRFLVLIREFTVGDMIAIFCIMSILSLLLAFRFGSRIVKETIVTRFLNQ